MSSQNDDLTRKDHDKVDGRTTRDSSYEQIEIRDNATAILGSVYYNYYGGGGSREPELEDARNNTRNIHWMVSRVPNGVFTGRETNLQIIKDAVKVHLQADLGLYPRCFVISGIGGAGKSELCLRTVLDLRSKFWGVFWIDMSRKHTAQTDFISISRRIGSAEDSVTGVVSLLSNLQKTWVLILDNADDRNEDYQQYMPNNELGIVLMTSRNTDCATEYGLLGHFELGGMEPSDSRTLLFKVAKVQPEKQADLTEEANEITKLLEHHPLALLQAGAYLSRGHCNMKQYPEHFNKYRSRVLTFRSTGRTSRYQTAFAAFEASASELEISDEEAAKDALDLINILGCMSNAELPLGIFEAAFIGSKVVFERQDTLDIDSDLSEWHIKHLTPLIQPYESEWSPFRLIEACHLLVSLSLITLTEQQDFEQGWISTHPLIHAWMSERQSSIQKEQSWLGAGALLSLSQCDAATWKLYFVLDRGVFAVKHDKKLWTHMKSWLPADVGKMADKAIASKPIAQMLHACVVAGIYADDLIALDYIEAVFLKLDVTLKSTLIAWHCFVVHYTSVLQISGRNDEAVKLLENAFSKLEADPCKDGIAFNYLYNLAAVTYSSNRYEECLRYCMMVENALRDFLPEPNVYEVLLMWIRSDIFLKLDRVEEAMNVSESCYTFLKNTPEFWDRYQNLYGWSITANLISCYQKLGKEEKSFATLLSMKQNVSKTLAKDDEWSVYATHNLSKAYSARKQFYKAIELLVEMLEVLSFRTARNDENRAETEALLAETFYGAKEIGKARNLAEKLLRGSEDQKIKERMQSILNEKQQEPTKDELSKAEM